MPLPPPVFAPSNEEVHAEILLWQARYRAIFLPLVGFATLTLKWFGVVSTDSALASRVAARDLLLISLGLMLAYLLFHRLFALWLRRTQRAGMGWVATAIASDMLVLFVVVFLTTPPAHYERALLVAVFTVQFTQIFFGWTATLINLALIAVGFTTIVAAAADAGALPTPTEQLWSLALYGIGVMVYVGLQGHLGARMQTLVSLFGRAQEGDFSARFEEPPGQMPDPVTFIGRAYNRMREHLHAIVLTDPLSGCFNRRGLNQLAERETARALRHKKELAVLAIDVDHFKRINDDYGHLTGDEVIREVGELLRKTAREADVVARFGGEEFTILAPESGDEGAMILANRVLEAFRTHRFKTLPPDVQITTSIGVAADVARSDEIAKTLLARADEALYVAKRDGRDRAVLWHAGMRAFDGPGTGRWSTPGMLRVAGDH